MNAEKNTHIIFICPPDFSQTAVYLPEGTLLFLANIVRKNGYSFDIITFDHINDPIKLFNKILSELDELVFHRLNHLNNVILGMSCFSSYLYTSTMLIGAYLRHNFPNIPIIVGGYHPTLFPNSLIECIGTDIPTEVSKSQIISIDFLFNITENIKARGDHVFDYVFKGRSEKSLVEILNHLRSNYFRPMEPVIVHQKAYDNEEVFQFRYKESVFDELLVQGSASRTIQIMFSLGCPFDCNFCVQSSNLRFRWQGMDPFHAIEVIELLFKKYKIKKFLLWDSCFAADKRWRENFFRELARKNWVDAIHVIFETNVLLFDLDDFSILKKFNLHIYLGLESCSPTMLQLMNKTRNPQKYLTKFEKLINDLTLNLSPHSLIHLNMLVGYPGETKETLKETFEFLINDCKVYEKEVKVWLRLELFFPVAQTKIVELTPEYSKQFGYESAPLDWWRKHLTDQSFRYKGKPSKDLSWEYCYEFRHFFFTLLPRFSSSDREDLSRWLSHPLIRIQQITTNFEEKADAILNKLKRHILPQTSYVNEAIFEQYAQDYSSKRLGEITQYGSLTTWEPSIEEIAFKLKDKELFKKPIKTSVGYAIIQRIE